MHKSILALAAIVAAGTLVQAPAAQASGLRIGLGFGVPMLVRPAIADSSILRRAEEAQRRVDARERQVLSGGRTTSGSKNSAAVEVKRQAAAAAAKARAEKLAAEAEAKRQARADAAAAAKAKNGVQMAKPASLPSVAAAPSAAAPMLVPTGDKVLDAAQEQQKAKAEQLLKSLAKPAAQQPSQGGSDVSPLDTGAPAAPTTVKVVAPAQTAPAAPAKVAPTGGECRRFIPGAGITVKVSCTE